MAAKDNTSLTSCRGLLYYFRDSSQGAVSEDAARKLHRTFCLGLESVGAPDDTPDLATLHAARRIPEDKQVDLLVVIGHTVYHSQAKNTTSEVRHIKAGKNSAEIPQDS
jgi:hypothetical protein